MRIVAVDTRKRFYVLAYSARKQIVVFKRLKASALRRRLLPPPLVENVYRFGHDLDMNGTVVFSGRYAGQYNPNKAWLHILRNLNLLSGHSPRVQDMIDALVMLEDA